MKTTQETKSKKSGNNQGRVGRGRPPVETRWKKGQSGNPKGKPKGSISITALVKKELEKMPEGEDKKTYADLIIKRIMSKAIKDGDTRMIEKIWAYIDGLPRQDMDITSGGKPLPLLGGKSNAKKTFHKTKDSI